MLINTIRILLLLCSVVLAYFIRQEFLSDYLSGPSKFGAYPELLLLIIFAYILLMYWRGGWADSWLQKKWAEKFKEHLFINGILLIIISVSAFYQQYHLLSRTFLVAFVVINFFLSVVTELFASAKRSNTRKVLAIGEFEFFKVLKEFCHSNRVGLVFLNSQQFSIANGSERIRLLQTWNPDQILTSKMKCADLEQIRQLALEAGINPEFRDLTSLSILFAHEHDFRKYEQYLRQYLLEPNHLESFNRCKRLLDLFILTILSPLWLLLLAILAVILKLGQEKVFYTQSRIGQFGRVFNIWKFCSMKSIRDDHSFAKTSSPHDTRLTRFGWFLRRTSLDELPQVWNVLRGEMSLVGPRPELVQIVNEKYDSMRWKRALIKPGLTGLWQIYGRRQPIHDHLKYDFFYLKNQGLLLDIYIILRTIPAILKRNGAL